MSELNNNKKKSYWYDNSRGAVAIALVTVYFLYDLASNHINDNTRVLTEVKESVGQSIEVGQEEIRVLGDLKDAINRIK